MGSDGMRRRTGWWWALLVVPLCVAYQLLVHSAIMDGQPGSLRFALASLPLLALSCWIAQRARRRLLWALMLLGAAAAIYSIEHQTGRGLAAAYGIPHAAIYLSLFWLFARTLKPGREPLVTTFARRVHGTLPPEMAAYTRRVTLAWCVFFIAQPLVSAALLAGTTLAAWSFFINMLNLPLLLLMFAGEYAYRIVRHRRFPHASIFQSVESYTEHRFHSDSAGGR